jgi:hypothetical protein
MKRFDDKINEKDVKGEWGKLEIRNKHEVF